MAANIQIDFLEIISAKAAGKIRADPACARFVPEAGQNIHLPLPRKKQAAGENVHVDRRLYNGVPVLLAE
jgi:hypothetical protein